MEVDTRLEVCNNLPAESASPKNGWRSSVVPSRRRAIVKESARVGGRGAHSEAWFVRSGAAARQCRSWW